MLLSVDHLQPFTFVKQLNWTDLSIYWKQTNLTQLNFTVSLQFPPFPSFNTLDPVLRHWTISPQDPGMWYLLSVHKRLVPKNLTLHLDSQYGSGSRESYRLEDFLPKASNKVWVFVDTLQDKEQRLFQPCSQEDLPKRQMMNSRSSRRVYQPLRFLIVSMSTSKRAGQGYSQFAAIRAAYSQRFNYKFELSFVGRESRPVEYRKIDVIEQYYIKYSSTDQFDYLFWMDWDTCIMNGTVSLDSFIPVSLPDIIMTDHDQPINNGAFFLRLRGVPRVKRFIQFWQRQSRLFDWLWTDNGSMFPSLIVFLDRDPDYIGECGHGHTVHCFIEKILSVAYKLPYGSRFSQYLYCIPAHMGFNNHHFSFAALNGWAPTTAYYPNRGMFVIHDKDEYTWGNLSEAVNQWSKDGFTTITWVNLKQ